MALLARTRLAEHPLLFGVQEGLWRVTLDSAAQRFLPAIRAGQVVVVKDEQANGQNRRDRDDGNHQTIQADSGGFHGHNFAVAIENAKGHQRCDQYGQRRDLIDHAGGKVEQIVANGRQREYDCE